ncbi:anti-sigma factor [Schlesneria sp. DSM 10557]|uniref:anti-sigma factor family protein n=2 Tax=unclassified Schlesneria TaxID=2762017 RepID=UPI0035A14D63
MDCRRAKELLSLWVGQDLPDAASNADVASHLAQCRDCDRHLKSLQASMDVLQACSSQARVPESRSASLWPGLVTKISDWEESRRRDRFNGWVPATVMSLAVILMVAVSIPSIHQVFFGEDVAEYSMPDRFLDPEFDMLRDPEGTISIQKTHQVTPVNYEKESW